MRTVSSFFTWSEARTAMSAAAAIESCGSKPEACVMLVIAPSNDAARPMSRSPAKTQGEPGLHGGGEGRGPGQRAGSLEAIGGVDELGVDAHSRAERPPGQIGDRGGEAEAIGPGRGLDRYARAGKA